jgi:His-Xaa-Ser system protein HxsD
MSATVQPAKNLVKLGVDEKIFPRPVAVAAAYVFIERCYVKLESAPNRRIQVQLKGKKKLGKSALTRLAEEFENELLHQLIRHHVAEKTSSLREVIVGRALFSAEPAGEEPAQDAVEEELDYLDDPLGIAVPWEEKYGDDKEEKS